jgi:hypothetical protein
MINAANFVILLHRSSSLQWSSIIVQHIILLMILNIYILCRLPISQVLFSTRGSNQEPPATSRSFHFTYYMIHIHHLEAHYKRIWFFLHKKSLNLWHITLCDFIHNVTICDDHCVTCSVKMIIFDIRYWHMLCFWDFLSKYLQSWSNES